MARSSMVISPEKIGRIAYIIRASFARCNKPRWRKARPKEPGTGSKEGFPAEPARPAGSGMESGARGEQ